MRVAAGLSPKLLEAAQVGLQNSLFAVSVRRNDNLVGMGRVIGDGACFFQVVDIAVHPSAQGQGIGTLIMQRIEAYLREVAKEGSYVSLMADKPEFYQKLGYQPTAPASVGMYKKF
ncbi:GNAT family N-acetyltransferase [Pleionea litopenaei]|uniref:GNAT family N-acetyltransferase n=1 Tax=Pleionea litopenaei TaxID=3070815 RepID=A0AA51RVX3_9GAMM|nr:GNAT family N-acetyltransferase [Pleionea sp. HL-JVS1]WMS88761.1 GNAT family N-acetyltransferase [Pleionea sp. HL-JVS1]